jgi:hypothetical protein
MSGTARRGKGQGRKFLILRLSRNFDSHYFYL